MKSIWVKMRAMSSPSVDTNPAMVVKCGWLSPDSAMKVTCSRQARSMLRLLTMPIEYANKMTFSNTHGGRVSGSARHIVFEPRIETGQIKLAIVQVIHRVLESAEQKLPLQVNGEKSRAGVYVFVTRHLRLQIIVPHFDIDIKFGSRQDAV